MYCSWSSFFHLFKRSSVIPSWEITDHIPSNHHPPVLQARASTARNPPNRGNPIIWSEIIQAPIPMGPKGAGIAHHQQTSPIVCLTVNSTSSLHHRGTLAPSAAQSPQYLSPDTTQHNLAGKHRAALENMAVVWVNEERIYISGSTIPFNIQVHLNKLKCRGKVHLFQ